MDAQKTGMFIQNLRKEKNMTQVELAEKIHVSDKAVSRWETGKGFPDINSFEDIAAALDTSVSELLSGERFEEYVKPAEVEEITTGGLALARQFIEKKRIRNIAAGFLICLLTMTLLISHLTAPLMIEGSGNTVQVEKLTDGKIIAVMDPAVSGYEYEIDRAEDPDTGMRMAFLGCYTTRWHQITGKSGTETVLILGREGEIDGIFYYPGAEGANELIYSEKAVEYGVVSLPRLIFNYWILIWGVLSAAGLAGWYLLRKKPYQGVLLKIVMAFVSLLAGHAAVLAGSAGAIYSPKFFLTGILLTALIIYLLFLLVDSGRKQRTKAKKQE